jgi:hypothetical protein
MKHFFLQVLFLIFILTYVIGQGSFKTGMKFKAGLNGFQNETIDLEVSLNKFYRLGLQINIFLLISGKRSPLASTLCIACQKFDNESYKRYVNLMTYTMSSFFIPVKSGYTINKFNIHAGIVNTFILKSKVENGDDVYESGEVKFVNGILEKVNQNKN